jgi:hypothetical protein
MLSGGGGGPTVFKHVSCVLRHIERIPQVAFEFHFIYITVECIMCISLTHLSLS